MGAGAPFVTQGSLTLPQGVTLRFRDGYTVQLSPRDREAPTELIAFCAPAPSRHATAARYDPRVRRALQCDAEDGRFVVEGFDPAATDILETVRRTLCPDDPNPLRADFYAVNVYPKGGHFARHLDTPDDADTVGMLVLCVSRNFHGGDLTLTRGNDTQRVTFQADGVGHEESGSCWAAFLGTADPDVAEVTVGERVTLTWTLHRTEGAPRAKNTREADAFTQHLRAALCDEAFGGVDDVTLAIPCTHLYAGTAGFVREVPPLDARTVQRLKGRDQTLAAVMLAQGLDVALAPMLVDKGSGRCWTLARFPSPKALELFGNERVTAEDIDRAFEVVVRPDDQRLAWLTHPVEGAAQKADREAAMAFLGAPEFSNTGAFGDEASDGDFYLHAALVAKVPRSGTAERTHVVTALGGAPKTVKTAKAAKTAVIVEKVAVAEKPAAAPAKAAVVEQSAPAPSKAASTTATKAAPTLDAKREYMASELHALGYTPATLRKALADGTLERSGFGWYRAGKSAK